jgi:hypothetical protein
VFLRNSGGELVKELAGDVCGMGSGGMERNGDAFIDGPLELREVGDDGLKGFVAVDAPDLGEVRELKSASTLEL